jgi:hypothetical protein
MAEWTDSAQHYEDAQPSLDRAKDIIVEFACATRAAALTAADERKQRAAEQVGGIAEALRSASRSLARSQIPTAARYTDRAAEQIEEVARALRERRWGELVEDVEQVARRQPALFVAGAVAIGFLIGRFLLLSSGDAARAMSETQPAGDAVTAAISSASGHDQPPGWTEPDAGPREMP